MINLPDGERLSPKALFDNLVEGIWVIDRDANTTYVNLCMAEMLGYRVDEMQGKHLFEFTDDRGIAAARESLERRRRGVSERHEFVFLRKDGSPLHATLATMPLMDKEGRYAGAIAAVLDITERRRAEERLRAYQRQLQMLASELSWTEETERREIAEALHDGVGQLLSLAQNKVEALSAAALSADTAAAAQEVRRLLDDAIHQTRRLTFDLSPPILYELGLEPALAWLAERFQERHGLPCRFAGDGAPKPLADNLRGVLFRATREALLNVSKHARAKNATVSVCRGDNHVEVTVEDDGIGFDAAAVQARPADAAGFGLFNIRERLTHLGGRVDVRSEPGRGTRIALIVPVCDDPRPREAP